MHSENDTYGLHINITGVVQGVGFRPFIHRRSAALSLRGFVRNTAFGAEICAAGTREAVGELVSELKRPSAMPRLAYIERVETAPLTAEEAAAFKEFSILSSDDSEEITALLSPDVCTCDDCLKELFSPSDRRYRYPFLNCTNCGPRFSIIRGIPYDRKKTTMAAFSMCEDCEREYTDITDRRYHAEPTCCADCGPTLTYHEEGGSSAGTLKDPVAMAQSALAKGKIVAVKGLGGFHLAALSDDAQLAARLRERKHRDEKPFALMCGDIAAVREICEVSAEEEELLKTPARPIVLLQKKDKESFLHISENNRIGVMLPYTPLHFLLFDNAPFTTLIMTSANLSDRPIIYDNEETLRDLKGIADAFLLHDRRIHRRIDDSVMWCVDSQPYFARRSRGYVPLPVFLREEIPPLLACGAEQKATFALGRGTRVFLSQHIGDLKNIESYTNYGEQISQFEELFEIRPEALACDLHPDYLSSLSATERAEKEGIPLIRVQHHHAHMVSCMTDNDLDGEAIGMIWDGTGLGTDGSAWGGEFLAGGAGGFTRMGSLRPIAMPGGDLVTKEIWRTGLVLARDAEIFMQKDEREALIENILSSQVNCPETSSMGRLFDGVSAILGICDEATYEGQGAILLEAHAAADVNEVCPYGLYKENGIIRFDHRPMIRELCRDIARGRDTHILAARFLNTLVKMATEICLGIAKETGLKRVVLSGGTFQNMYLVKKFLEALRAEGLTPYLHRRVSANDEGISLGQLMVLRKSL